jgi:hypothetical protein
MKTEKGCHQVCSRSHKSISLGGSPGDNALKEAVIANIDIVLVLFQDEAKAMRWESVV